MEESAWAPPLVGESRFPCLLGGKTIQVTASVMDEMVKPNGQKNETPFLLGRRLLGELDAYISVKTGKFIIPGPGGIKLQLSPGTEVVQMHDKGHWYLPVNEKLKDKMRHNKGRGKIFFKKYSGSAADYAKRRKLLSKTKSH